MPTKTKPEQNGQVDIPLSITLTLDQPEAALLNMILQQIQLPSAELKQAGASLQRKLELAVQ